MLFLVILILALGWAGWLWAWGRDRVTTSYGFAPILGASASTRWGTPQTATMARSRRRDLLALLVGAAFISFLFARSWAVFWMVHATVDVALACYSVAVVLYEQRTAARPAGVASRAGAQPTAISPFLASPRMTLQPIGQDRVSAS